MTDREKSLSDIKELVSKVDDISIEDVTLRIQPLYGGK
jgi:hypothetical protein